MKFVHTVEYEVVHISVKDFLASDHCLFMETKDDQPHYRGANSDYLESLNPRRKIYAVLHEVENPTVVRR